MDLLNHFFFKYCTVDFCHVETLASCWGSCETGSNWLVCTRRYHVGGAVCWGPVSLLEAHGASTFPRALGHAEGQEDRGNS